MGLLIWGFWKWQPVPGSHSSAAPQGHWLGDRPEAALSATAAAMAPGSVVIYYASTLHGSGENQSPAVRTGLNFNYAFVDEAGVQQFLIFLGPLHPLVNTTREARSAVPMAATISLVRLSGELVLSSAASGDTLEAG
eukprot:s283_g12.t2